MAPVRSKEQDGQIIGKQSEQADHIGIVQSHAILYSTGYLLCMTLHIDEDKLLYLRAHVEWYYSFLVF